MSRQGGPVYTCKVSSPPNGDGMDWDRKNIKHNNKKWPYIPTVMKCTDFLPLYPNLGLLLLRLLVLTDTHVHYHTCLLENKYHLALADRTSTLGGIRLGLTSNVNVRLCPAIF